MSDAKFTPKSCKVCVDDSGFHSVIEEDEPILCDGPHHLLARDVSPNYAHLFAAAPDMYDVLKECLSTVADSDELIMKASKAIAKAEGR